MSVWWTRCPTSRRSPHAAALKSMCTLAENLRGDLGVGSDEADVWAVLLERRKRPLHPLLLGMALEVGEEHVGPGPLAARAALYAGEVDLLLGERRERVPQNQIGRAHV